MTYQLEYNFGSAKNFWLAYQIKLDQTFPFNYRAIIKRIFVIKLFGIGTLIWSMDGMLGFFKVKWLNDDKNTTWKNVNLH